MEYILTNDFEVIDMGIQEVDVYDIEVDKTHNFFGNGICIHNSVYLRLDELVKLKWSDLTDHQEIADRVDEFAKSTIEPYIEQCYTELADYMNAHENLLDMKREAIADCFIIRAKKNYVMRVIDNEGIRYATPQMKQMGYEAVKTTHAMLIRDMLSKCMNIIFDGTVQELRDEVASFKEYFMNCPVEEIAMPRRVNNVSKYSTPKHGFVSGITIPLHIRGAINYNRMVDQCKISNRHPFLRGGENSKYLLLQEPNPLGQHVISFIDTFPPEFKLDQYVDRGLHYEKYFLKPLESFMIYNGWTIEENSLNDLLEGHIDIAKVASIKNEKKEKKPPVDLMPLF